MKTVLIGKKHTPLVIGNWKMNPNSLSKAEMLAKDLKKALGSKDSIAHVAVAAPFVYSSTIGKLFAKSRIALAAQDVSHEVEGAHTGETSVEMLKDLKVAYVIAGHSERRAQGESNEEVSKNTARILKSGMTAVVCVGEKTRDTQGDYFGVIETQLRIVLREVPASSVGRLVIAYEPVWAIGTGKHASAEDVQEMKLFIQKVIADTHGRKAVAKVRVLYGGSVTKDNAEELLETGRADGFLVGGSSLKALEFAAIIKIADAYGTK
jgi:triosephosphate isomerase